MNAPTAFPHAIEAERALLGGLIVRPEELDEIDGLEPGDFYRSDHATLYALLRDMHQSGDRVDMITVPERVSRQSSAERFGGVAYVVELPDHCVSTANLAAYADVIRDHAARRRLIAACQAVAEQAYQADRPPEDLVVAMRSKLDAVGTMGIDDDWQWYSELIPQTVTRLAERGGAQQARGPSTGFSALDAQIGCLGAGELVFIGGRPGMAKTALVLQIGEHVAGAGGPVAVFSLEMDRGQLAERSLASSSEVSVRDLRAGQVSLLQLGTLQGWAAALAELPVAVCDRPGLSLEEVVARAIRLDRAARQRGYSSGLQVIVVDYLQLMKVRRDRGENQAQAVAHIAQGLKNLARSTDSCVIALSQLSRAVEGRANKRPKLSDLRDSGGIEAAADIVMLLYRDEVYNPETRDKGVVEVIIAKHRHDEAGEKVVVPLGFDGPRTKLFDRPAAWVREWLGQRRRGKR